MQEMGGAEGKRLPRLSFSEDGAPVSIYVNYRGERKSRSPRCSVGKVGSAVWASTNRHEPRDKSCN